MFKHLQWTYSKSVKSPIAMHPLKIDSMEKEARIIVLVKDGEIGGWAKLKQATQAIPVSIGPLQVN